MKHLAFNAGSLLFSRLTTYGSAKAITRLTSYWRRVPSDTAPPGAPASLPACWRIGTRRQGCRRSRWAVLPALAVLLFGLLARDARAAAGILWFDPNGYLPGTGIINNGTYSWEGPNWTSDTGYWVPGSMAGFYGGANGNIYTVTVHNNELLIGLMDSAADLNLTLNAADAGTLELASGLQGFYCAGTVKITAPISGAGGIAPEFNGLLYLYGTNSYAGGTQFGVSGSPRVFFNNNSSFGTGPLFLGPFTQLAAPEATAPITLTNSIQAAAGTFLFVGTHAAPLTCTSPWALPPGTLTFSVGNSSYSTSQMTLSGPISGTGAGLIKSSPGTLVLAGTNTYDGNTTLQGGTLEIAGAILGNVTNSGGVLQLDSPTALSASAVVALASALPAGAVNLHFTGTQTVLALTFDGVSQAAGTWGAPASGAQNTSPLFTGAGQLRVAGPPGIARQPQSGSVYPDAAYTFSVAVTGDPSFTYQWKFNGSNLPGATDSSYTVSPVEAPNAGSYSCWVTNRYGWTNTLEATLTVLATNAYVNAIRADHPIAYWRLDETSGTLAYDGVGGNVGTYHNVLLNQPGWNVRDPDPGIGLPANSAARSFVQVTNYAPFSFPGAAPFTVEAWAFFTNLTGPQRLFSTMSMTPPHGWAFGIINANGLRFTTGTVQDADQSLTTPLVPGVWYHLACTCDGTNYHFYVNGREVGTGVPVLGGGNTGVNTPLTLGCNPTNSLGIGYPVAEQLKGRLDEVAIYNYALSAEQLYWQLRPPVSSGPPLVFDFSHSVTGTNPVTGTRTVLLSAWVNPNNLNSVAWFEYGLDTTYPGSSEPIALLASTMAKPVTATLEGLVPGALYHCRVGASNSLGVTYSADQRVALPSVLVPGDLNSDGVVDTGELNAVLTNYWPNSPWLMLTNTVGLGSTQVQFALTNTSDWSFSVLMSTNLMDWEYLGPATPLYQFTDPAATNSPQRFYRLQWP